MRILLILLILLVLFSNLTIAEEEFDFEKNCEVETCSVGDKGENCHTDLIEDKDECIYLYSIRTEDYSYCHLMDNKYRRNMCYSKGPYEFSAYWVLTFIKILLVPLVFVLVFSAIFFLLSEKKIMIIFYVIAGLSVLAGILSTGANIGWWLQGGVGGRIHLIVIGYLLLSFPLLSLIVSFFIRKKWYYLIMIGLNVLCFLLLLLSIILPAT